MADDSTTRHWERLTPLFGRYFLIAFAVWTAVIAAFFIWDLNITRRFILKEAQTDALANYNKDVAFREWATTHGGVYVPVDERTPPNPYLTNIPERDIVTPSGKRLTLMNPAYMARQMNDFFAKKGTVFGHITSLKLKNPDNKADAWEEEALRAFEKGETERIEVSEVGGQPFLRLMRPMVTKAGCLKCHADQGYKVGDVRGGVSVSVGLAPYYAEARALEREHALVSGLAWLLGSLGLLAGYGYARRLGRARDQAREDLRRSEVLLNQTQQISHVGGWEFDVSSGKLLWTEETYRIYEVGAEYDPNYINADIKFYAPADQSVIENAFKRAVEFGEPYDLELQFTGAKGTRKWVRTSAHVEWLGGKVSRVFGNIMDITGQKAVEEKLKAAKEEAEAATRIKDKFVSIVSHDLKSPITSMIGFLKLVRDDETTPLDEGAKLILDRAIDSSKQLSRLIGDLLNLSRLKTGQLKLDKQFFDAKYLGAKMCVDFAYSAGSKGIKLICQIPDNSRLFGDKTLLGEALQNLVTNAIKFCRQGDTITISLSDTNTAAIQVKDTGPGIKPDQLSKLFTFESKVSTVGTAGEMGTGFGLPLAKDIMLLHGGDLIIASEADKGTTVTLSLPYVKPRLLIVDDDPVFRFLLAQILKDLNADIMQAEDGAVAADIIAKAHDLPNLIISDIEMPNMDGLKLLSYLHNRHETRSIPVIVVSGKHGMEIRDTVYGLGGKDFLTKQLDIDDFIPRVRRFIS